MAEHIYSVAEYELMYAEDKLAAVAVFGTREEKQEARARWAQAQRRLNQLSASAMAERPR